jgi:4-diphosphocytidyl-2-C-methyl-D-erythritol kinase
VSAVIDSLAPAKVNLTLHILGRRADGYHDLESLVAFASFGDKLSLCAGAALGLAICGPTSAAAGPVADNLVLRAARALAERIEGVSLGHFTLTKRLPAGAGLGGGSSDAAAALRLIARVNALELDDPRIHDAARSTGADVPVCLDPRPRLMRGIGDVLSAPLALPALGIVVVYPGIAVPTAAVFKALGLAAGERHSAGGGGGCGRPAPPTSTFAERDPRGSAAGGAGVPPEGAGSTAFIASLAAGRNDLEAAAVGIAPQIAEALTAVAALPGCRLARMSGSGSACFGLFEETQAALAAARGMTPPRPGWWVQAGSIGG